MSSVNVIEEWVTTSDGKQLYTKTWQLPSKPKAHLLIIHGFGDHCTRYDALARVFASHGIQTHGYDQRGWGETGKKYQSFGNNQGYNTALGDINEAIHRIKQEDIPLFILGHSMGGGLILNYLARHDTYDGTSKVAGAIASAPLVTLTTPIPAIKYHSLKMVSYVLPSFGIRGDMNPDFMSHDKEAVEQYKSDPLVHDFTTIATARGFLEAGTNLLTIGNKIKTPILFSHGDADPVNLYDSTKRVYENASSSDKELKTWEGLYHELHNERQPDRDNVADYYTNWIKQRIL
ncbi:Alpha/Beta hydrolase protein [Chlamydoabsidia padenii]|nr:Alpha/Beta hydrolase protein [Chlamydoabsidia padenii]